MAGIHRQHPLGQARQVAMRGMWSTGQLSAAATQVKAWAACITQPSVTTPASQAGVATR